MASDLKNQLQEKKSGVTTAQKKNKSLLSQIDVMKPQIAKALPSVITPERFTRMVMTAVSSNPQLASCTFESFCGAMLQSAQLGLEPNTPLGQAYLIPRRNGRKGVTECQFQLGYQGMLALAYRGGATMITAHEVCENDSFEYEYGLEPFLKHKPAIKGRGAVIAYYATYKLENGGFGFAVMSKEDIENHAKRYSDAYKSSYSPWSTQFDEMAKKTVIKKALKYAPMSAEFMKSMNSDETVKSWNDKDDFSDIVSVQGEFIEPENVNVTEAETEVPQFTTQEEGIPTNFEEPEFMKG